VQNWLIPDLADAVTEEQLTITGLYATLRDLGITPHAATQRIGAKIASEDEADLLDLEPASPLVTMHRVMQDTTGRVIEVADAVYDGSQYAVEMSIVNP
jgi:DNA-binding GntR family transcriptional regulator